MIVLTSVCWFTFCWHPTFVLCTEMPNCWDWVEQQLYFWPTPTQQWLYFILFYYFLTEV